MEALPPAELRRRCDPGRFAFATTDELQGMDGTPGQQRATQALEFGVGMRARRLQPVRHGAGRQRAPHARPAAARGAGPRPGGARRTGATSSISSRRTGRARCACPRAGRRPSRQTMARLVEDLSAAIPAAFETDEYRNRRQEIDAEFERAPRARHRRDRRKGARAGHRAGAHAERLRLRARSTRATRSSSPTSSRSCPPRSRSARGGHRAPAGGARATSSTRCRSGGARRSDTHARAQPPGDARPRSTA